MKYFLAVVITLVSLVVTDIAFAQVRVRGYTRKDGTYVQPHYRSSPDSNPYNNYSTRGNVNPYTGAIGTRNVDSFNSGSSYSPPSNSNSSYGGFGSQPDTRSQYDNR